MQNIERRIASLEAESRAGDGAIKVVIVEDGESKADALARAHLLDATNVWNVVFVSPTDAQL